MGTFPIDIQDFGNAFVDVQRKRHAADYDPSYRAAKTTVLTDIGTAEAAIRKLRASSLKDRRALAAWVTLGYRR